MLQSKDHKELDMTEQLNNSSNSMGRTLLKDKDAERA